MQIHQAISQDKTFCGSIFNCQNRASTHPYRDETVTGNFGWEFYREKNKKCAWRLGWLVRKTILALFVLRLSRFNSLSHLTASQVCLASNTSKAAKVINHLIQVAMDCCAAGNWNSAMAIALGLNLTPVARLTKTWSKVKSEKLLTLKVSWRF